MWWLTIPVIIYSAGIIVLLVILRRRSDSGSPADVCPSCGGRTTVTVVVAARNEEKNISVLLESLLRQDYPPDLLDIIIVNDNSTDRTPIVVSEFIEMHKETTGIRMRLIFNPFPGKKRAIRYGIEKADSDVIITTDADCIVGPGWVSAHAAAYMPVALTTQPVGRAGAEPAAAATDKIGAATSANTAVGHIVETTAASEAGAAGIADMVLGEVYQGPAKGFAALFGRFEFSALQSITEAAVLAGQPVMCNAGNMSFRREVYLRHRGELHDELPSGDDMFLLHAVRRAGGRVVYAGSGAAAAETAPAVTAAALLRQRARWASKTFFYRDGATLTLAAATAACNAAVAAAAVASFISAANLPLLAALYGLRLVPDYLIIARKIKKRGGKMPLIPFLASEMIYPFYFVTVAAISIFPRARRFGRR